MYRFHYNNRRRCDRQESLQLEVARYATDEKNTRQIKAKEVAIYTFRNAIRFVFVCLKQIAFVAE